ncbi:hypothetical protein D3C80_1497890 [compost metagenome]
MLSRQQAPVAMNGRAARLLQVHTITDGKHAERSTRSSTAAWSRNVSKAAEMRVGDSHGRFGREVVFLADILRLFLAITLDCNVS